jgi:hypothetical protein
MIIILKTVISTTQKYLWHTCDVTYNLMYSFQHTSKQLQYWTLWYVSHIKISMMYMWCHLQPYVFFQHTSKRLNIEHCDIYHTPKYLRHTCDDLQLYVLFSTHIFFIHINNKKHK